jgi:hypothetical protein
MKNQNQSAKEKSEKTNSCAEKKCYRTSAWNEGAVHNERIEHTRIKIACKIIIFKN